jgi:hypothetical protein
MNETKENKVSDLDKEYYYTFTSAIEGGINYWAKVLKYSAKDNPKTKEDWGNFSATIQVTEFSEDETDPRLASSVNGQMTGKTYKVDRSTLSKGMRLVASGKTNVHPSYASRFAVALKDSASADLDALDADIAIQAGIFGEVIFG